jgi:hypothetical protein
LAATKGQMGNGEFPCKNSPAAGMPCSTNSLTRETQGKSSYGNQYKYGGDHVRQ